MEENPTWRIRINWFSLWMKTARWIANHLPKEIVYWAGVRIEDHLTRGYFQSHMMSIADALSYFENDIEE